MCQHDHKGTAKVQQNVGTHAPPGACSWVICCAILPTL